MLAHDIVERPTHDIDLFTPKSGEVSRLADALAAALVQAGASVQAVVVNFAATQAERLVTHPGWPVVSVPSAMRMRHP